MNKKGFTLIELAAVILVLAILALIATPIIMNTIENAKKGAAERSADHYINAVNTTAAMDGIANGLLPDGIYKVIENGNLCKVGTDCSTTPSLVVDVKGDLPLVGSGVEIKDGQVLKEGSLIKISDYEIIYPEGTAKAWKNNWTELEDVCTLVSGAANEVGASYTCNLGDKNRTFYVLEAATLVKPATLILSEDYATGLTWCIIPADNYYTNKCAADGLTEKLNEAATVWSKVAETQIGLPSANQILVASKLEENKTTSSSPIDTWLQSKSTGYWTSTPATDWPQYSTGDMGYNNKAVIAVMDKKWMYATNANNTNLALRPVVKFQIDVLS